MPTKAFVTALLLIPLVGHAAPITYSLTTDLSNSDAVLNGGFLRTDGTTGSQLDLTTILLDWEISITENGTSIVLTPSNSSAAQVETNTLLLDVSADEITFTGAGSATSPATFSIASNDPSAPGSYMVLDLSGGGFGISVWADALGNSTSGTPFFAPHVLATAASVPAPATWLLALLGAALTLFSRLPRPARV